MKIGEDYEKMEFTFLDLNLLEPNALLTDSLIAVIGIVMGIIVWQRNKQFTTPFFNYWKWLFLIYGIGFFFGGMGHVFFGYFGATGKYYALIFGLFIPLLIESAMITMLPKESQKKWFLLSKIKFVVAFIALTMVILFVKGDKTLPTLLLVPSVNTLIGLVLSCAILGQKLSRSVAKSFRLLPISVYIMVPAAVFQMLKISIHPWFDRNDAGHVLLMSTLFLYYFAVEGYRKHLLAKATS